MLWLTREVRQFVSPTGRTTNSNRSAAVEHLNPEPGTQLGIHLGQEHMLVTPAGRVTWRNLVAGQSQSSRRGRFASKNSLNQARNDEIPTGLVTRYPFRGFS